MVGLTLIVFTAITVFLSYVDFGTQKANMAVAMLVATFKAGLVAAIFMHLSNEKRIIYRILIFTGFLRPRTFLPHLSGLVRSRSFAKCRSKVSISSSSPCRNAACARAGRLVRLGQSRRRARRSICAGAIGSFVAAVGPDGLRHLVLSENETAPDHHMKAKFILALVLFLGSQTGQALACSVCFGARDSQIDRAHGRSRFGS